MSTNSPATPKATVGTILNSVSQIGGYIGLAVQVGEVLIPIGKALVTRIKDATTGVVTISYQLLITEDQAVLAGIDSASLADLQALNAELVRQGAVPLPLPPS